MLTPTKLQQLIIISRRSRKGKKKSARSQFYSKLMTGLAGDRGEKIAQAFVKQDTVKFTQEWQKLSKELILFATSAEDREHWESE